MQIADGSSGVLFTSNADGGIGQQGPFEKKSRCMFGLQDSSGQMHIVADEVTRSCRQHDGNATDLDMW